MACLRIKLSFTVSVFKKDIGLTENVQLDNYVFLKTCHRVTD